MTDEPVQLSPQEALDDIKEMGGQSYHYPARAQDVLAPFANEATDDFCERYDIDPEYRQLSVSHAIADAQVLARDARGLTSAPAWQPIITGRDISVILVEMLGGEPSDATMGGAGYTFDAQHRENVEWIYEWCKSQGEDD